MLKYQELINDIASGGVHIGITKNIIERLCSPLYLNKKGEPIFSDSMEACLKIHDNNYTDAIFEDLSQAIMLEIINLSENDLVSVYHPKPLDITWHYVNGEWEYTTPEKVKFLDYTEERKDGTIIIKSSYLSLYRAFRQCLATYSGKQRNAKGKLQIADAVYITENEDHEEEQHVLTNKASNYNTISAQQWDGNISDVINRNDVQLFFRSLKNVKSPERFEKICNITQSMLEGMTQKEIAEKHGYTLGRVEKILSDMRKFWKEWHFDVSLSKQFNARFGKGVEGTIVTMKANSHTVKDGIKVDMPNIDGIYRNCVSQYELMENYGLYENPDNNPKAHVTKSYHPSRYSALYAFKVPYDMQGHAICYYKRAHTLM